MKINAVTHGALRILMICGDGEAVSLPEMARRLAATGRARIGIGFVASTLYGYLPEVIRRYKAAAVEILQRALDAEERDGGPAGEPALKEDA